MSTTTKSMPETTTVAVNGATIEYALGGEGSSPVIVLMNGFRMPLSSWEQLYPEIHKYGRVFAYNRHGIGKTSKATCPQTGAEILRSLANVLQALQLPPPYILVAHSLGGLFANLYARSHPKQVAAVVFVDASHPDEIKQQKQFPPPWLLRVVNDAVKKLEIRFDPYRYSEDDAVLETLRQIEAAGNFPPIPVAVVTGSKKMPLVPQASFALHLHYQKELATLSPDAHQMIAEGSGHFPQISEPQLVVRAIKDVADKVKLGSVAGNKS